MRIFPPNKLEVVDGGEPREVFHTGNTPIQPNATNLILDSGAKLGIGTTDPGTWQLKIDGPALGTTIGNRVDLIEGLSNTGNVDNIQAFWERRVGASGWFNADFVIRRLIDGVASRGELRFGPETSLSNDGGPVLFKTFDTERLRIDASGNLLVGTTSKTQSFDSKVDAVAEAGQVALIGYLKSNISTAAIQRWQSDVGGVNNQVARVNANGNFLNTNNSYGALSDIFLKSNIVDASPQWADLRAIKVRSYTLNSTGDTHIGVVAQEIEEVAPGLVQEGEDGLKSVKYSVLYMKAVKALQEAMERIEALESRVNELENK